MNYILAVLLALTSACFIRHASSFTVGDAPEAGDGAKTWNKVSNLYMFYHTVEKLQKYEDLLNQYRAYLISSLLENNDSCALFEYMTSEASDVWASQTPAGNRVRRGIEEMTREESNRHPSALDTFFEISALVRDKLFYLKLLDKLEEACGDPRSTFYKRDGGKIIGKKVKFHSWGGKRAEVTKSLMSDPVISGMRRSPNPPFHSWGG